MSKYNDEYEDIFSGREESDYPEYEDIYSGRDDIKKPVQTPRSSPLPKASQPPVASAAPRQPVARQVYQREKYTPYGTSTPSQSSTPPGYENVYSNVQAQRRQAPQAAPSGASVRAKAPAGKKRTKRIIALFLVIVLLFTGVVGYMGYSLIDKINYVPSKHTNLYLDSTKLVSDSRVKNVLFIGCDDDSGGSQRSDSIMLVSIDRVHHKIKLTSFMRDTWVYIPDHDYAKLNAAFAYGGAGLLMDTIEYNFGIKIDSYALVDFEIFSSIIDELGGVEVEVTEKEAEFINRTTRQRVSSGVTTLNGAEALVYCRIRYLDSDFMRTQRQRKVMTAIVAKVKSAGPLTDYKLAQVILPQVKTDITKSEMIGIMLGALGYLTYDIEQLRIPVDDSYSSQYFGSQQALSIDFDRNKQELKSFIYGD